MGTAGPQGRKAAPREAAGASCQNLVIVCSCCAPGPLPLRPHTGEGWEAGRAKGTCSVGFASAVSHGFTPGSLPHVT